MDLLQGECFMLRVRHRLPEILLRVYTFDEVHVVFVRHVEPTGEVRKKISSDSLLHQRGGKEPWISPAGEAGDGGSATCCWGGVWHSCGVELVSPSSQQNRPSCFPGHRGPSQAGSGHSSWSPCRPLESTAGADSTQQSDSETSKQLCSNGGKKSQESILDF